MALHWRNVFIVIILKQSICKPFFKNLNLDCISWIKPSHSYHLFPGSPVYCSCRRRVIQNIFQVNADHTPVFLVNIDFPEFYES